MQDESHTLLVISYTLIVLMLILLITLSGCRTFGGAISGLVKDIGGAKQDMTDILGSVEESGLMDTLLPTVLGGGALGGIVTGIRSYLKAKKATTVATEATVEAGKQKMMARVLSQGLYAVKQGEPVGEIADIIGMEAKTLGIKKEMNALYDETKSS